MMMMTMTHGPWPKTDDDDDDDDEDDNGDDAKNCNDDVGDNDGWLVDDFAGVKPHRESIATQTANVYLFPSQC